MRASMSRALARATCAGSRRFDLLPGGCRDQALDVFVIEGLAARDGVEQVPVDADHEMPGKVHALHGNLSACADRDPDGRARDRDARPAFEHGVEVVGARIAAAGAAKAETVAQQRADQRSIGRAATVQTAARAQLTRQLVEALEPALRLHARAVVGREPERALGDIAISRGAFEHRLAWLQSLHGR